MNREREGAYLHHFSDFLCSKLDDEAGSTFEGYTGTPSEEYRVRSPTEQRDAGGALTERSSWQPCTDYKHLGPDTTGHSSAGPRDTGGASINWVDLYSSTDSRRLVQGITEQTPGPRCLEDQYTNIQAPGSRRLIQGITEQTPRPSSSQRSIYRHSGSRPRRLDVRNTDPDEVNTGVGNLNTGEGNLNTGESRSLNMCWQFFCTDRQYLAPGLTAEWDARSPRQIFHHQRATSQVLGTRHWARRPLPGI